MPRTRPLESGFKFHNIRTYLRLILDSAQVIPEWRTGQFEQPHLENGTKTALAQYLKIPATKTWIPYSGMLG